MKIISGEERVNLQDDIKECVDIEELKNIICAWLDESIERDGFQEDAEITSATTEGGKFYFLINDVVMTHPENTERQDLLFSIERVESQNVRSI
jgi:hypothetical protein